MLYLTHSVCWDMGASVGAVLPHQHQPMNWQKDQLNLTCSLSSPPAQMQFHSVSEKHKELIQGLLPSIPRRLRSSKWDVRSQGAIPACEEAVPGAEHQCVQVGCCPCSGGTAQGWDPGECQSLMTLLPLEHIRRKLGPGGAWVFSFGARAGSALC